MSNWESGEGGGPDIQVLESARKIKAARKTYLCDCGWTAAAHAIEVGEPYTRHVYIEDGQFSILRIANKCMYRP